MDFASNCERSEQLPDPNYFRKQVIRSDEQRYD